MDDVDRLFQCFKCGITPPESAMRERKRSRSKLRRGIPGKSDISSPESAAPEQKKAATSSSSSTEKSIQTKSKAPSFCSEKKFSPVVFYGSPHGIPPKRPSRLFLRLLQEIREDCAVQRKSSSSKKIWSTFPRQEEAMKFANGHENARVFSYQDHVTGQRRFLISTYTEFWERYKNMESKFRHHYEVIQEGLPCHLYFDLEFSTKENADRDGDEMVDLLISVIFQALLDKYTIQGHREWILELDSSTDAKFSRHLIIRVPKTAFKDNLHAGAFVNEICSRILSRKEDDKLLEKLLIRKEAASTDSDCHIFVDTAVYTRNRCFRLALSSKAGKTSVLLPSGRYNPKDMCEEDLFMRSLICNMDADCEKLLICKTDALCMKTLQFNTEVNNYGSRRFYDWPRELKLKGRKIESSTACLMGKSPFPALDAFIETIATIGEVSGKIASWILFPEDGLMVYSMSRNRYCERIGRQHKSNHVMYVVDLRRADYYQKCHDPDCRGYRSPLRPIPWEFVPETVLSQGCEDDASNAADCSTPDSWWLEAARLADKVEKKQDLSQLSVMGDIDDVEEDDEDDSWWLAAEKTAFPAETSHLLA